MSVLAYSLALLAAGILTQLLVLRIRPGIPGKPAIAKTLAVFAAVLLLGLVVPLWAGMPAGLTSQGRWAYLHVILFFVPASLSYVITYVGLEEDSPSMSIVGFVAQAGPRGRSHEELQGIISDDQLILPRIDALRDSGWVDQHAGRYRITAKGARYRAIFRHWANLNNLPSGG